MVTGRYTYSSEPPCAHRLDAVISNARSVAMKVEGFRVDFNCRHVSVRCPRGWRAVEQVREKGCLASSSRGNCTGGTSQFGGFCLPPAQTFTCLDKRLRRGRRILFRTSRICPEPVSNSVLAS